MPAYPVPAHPVPLPCLVQRLPQLGILHRLSVGGPPAIPLPVLYPPGNAVAQIVAVGVKVDLAGLLQRVQRLDGGNELHAVVGGGRLPTRKLLLHTVVAQDGAPAAWAGISGTGAVGEHVHLLHASPIPYSAGEALCRWKRIRRTYSIGSRFSTKAPSDTVSQS